MIRLEAGIYSLTTGNLILNEEVPPLREKLEQINSCDKAGLKELFRKAIIEQDIHSEGTGNMGLIEMARKSGNKLVYQFDHVNDQYSYYTLTIKVEEQLD